MTEKEINVGIDCNYVLKYYGKPKVSKFSFKYADAFHSTYYSKDAYFWFDSRYSINYKFNDDVATKSNTSKELITLLIKYNINK
jgi:hypothetical protein